MVCVLFFSSTFLIMEEIGNVLFMKPCTILSSVFHISKSKKQQTCFGLIGTCFSEVSLLSMPSNDPSVFFSNHREAMIVLEILTKCFLVGFKISTQCTFSQLCLGKYNNSTIVFPRKPDLTGMSSIFAKAPATSK